MKKIIIKLIKKNPFIYKKIIFIHQKFILKRTVGKKNKYKHICYALNNIDELKNIQEHYSLIKTPTTKLVIIINHSDYNLQLHKLIEQNPKITFISYDYISKYTSRINLPNCIFIDYEKFEPELISKFI